MQQFENLTWSSQSIVAHTTSIHRLSAPSPCCQSSKLPCRCISINEVDFGIRSFSMSLEDDTHSNESDSETLSTYTASEEKMNKLFPSFQTWKYGVRWYHTGASKLNTEGAKGCVNPSATRSFRCLFSPLCRIAGCACGLSQIMIGTYTRTYSASQIPEVGSWLASLIRYCAENLIGTYFTNTKNALNLSMKLIFRIHYSE